MMSRRTFLAGTAGVLYGVTLGSAYPAWAKEAGLDSLSGRVMGTYYRIVFPQGLGFDDGLQLNVLGTLAEVDRLMSTYKANSEVSLFNDAAPNSPLAFSDLTCKVVEEARRIRDLTEGAFDPTIGPLVNLWGFGPLGGSHKVPSARQVSKTVGVVGMDGLHLKDGSCWKTTADLAIDLNGIAKGFAVDRLATMLDALEVPGYLIDIGGELRAKGQKPDKSGWRVGIERPEPAERKVHRVLQLQDQAVATSGDYRDFFTVAERNYSHVIDPRTARPVAHTLASVTVVDRQAMTADALSTALMVMGPDEGFEFAQRNGIAASFILRTEGGLADRHTDTILPWLEKQS